MIVSIDFLYSSRVSSSFLFFVSCVDNNNNIIVVFDFDHCLTIHCQNTPLSCVTESEKTTTKKNQQLF